MIKTMALMSRLDALVSKPGQRLHSLSDSELVEQFQRKRDVDVFEILVQRYRNKVFAMAASILGRGAGSEAEDATQEVFIIVYHQLGTFRGEAAFSSWLYRVARNQIAGFRRRPAHRVVSGSEEGMLALPDTDTHSDPAASMAKTDDRQQLLQVVDKLAEPQKTIVHLFYWQEQSISAISSLLGLGSNTVKSHLRRARMNLAGLLREGVVDD